MAFTAINGIVFSQMQTIQFNNKKMLFDDGRELPAEKAFMVTTDAGSMTALIKMQISNGVFEKNKILFESSWKRKDDDKATVAALPNHYKLRSGNDFFIRFLYFRKVKENERTQIRSMLEQTAESLIRSTVQLKDNRFAFSISPSELYVSLNSIIEEGMVNYETKTGVTKPKFSGVMENMLRSLVKTRTKTDSLGVVNDEQFMLLLSQAQNEIEMITNQYVYVLEENITIPDYPVERKRNQLALNIGYAGVYNKGGFSDLDYLSGPYAGVSFPLGNRVFSGRFWNNASISAGIFLKDFVLSDSVKNSGPVVKKPLYAALGYRLFDYLKIHAGAAILEEKSNIKSNKSIFIKPFIGLSFEFNLWLGVGKN